MKKSLLKDALKIAQTKVLFHPEFKFFIHFTFIVQKNKIVEWGTNNKAIPHIHYGYHGRISDLRYAPKTHAEIHAWKKARGLLHKKPFQVINIRLNKKGQLRLSKPCTQCHKILKNLGCTAFYYSSEVGFLKTNL